MRKERKMSLWTVIWALFVVCALLFAGAIDVSAEEDQSQSFLTLDKIQEVGTDDQSLIKILQEEEKYYQRCLESFQKNENDQAAKKMEKRLGEIRRELTYLLGQKEILSSQKE